MKILINPFDKIATSLEWLDPVRRMARRFVSCFAVGSCGVLPMVLGTLTVQAQPIKPEVLFVFPYGNSPPGPENPYGNLIPATDGSFYGTSRYGGANRHGTVFKVTTDGSLTTIASFNGTNGASPHAAVTLGPDGNYYGTTLVGGSTENGTVFKVTTNGELTMLASFDGVNGKYPEAELTLGDDGNLYGTTSQGGAFGFGTVFRVTTDGALTTLVNFDGSNGSYPEAALTKHSDGSFYGTTARGGNGYGTVFNITTNGELTTLASFNGTDGDVSHAALTLGPDGNYYGTTSQGNAGPGTIFKVTTDGVLTRLAAFSGANGFEPLAPLTLGNDGNFYGTTAGGGNSSGYGTVFRVTTNGALTRLVAFNGANGTEPHSGLTLGSDGYFYGMTASGGGGGTGGTGAGTVFRMTSSGSLTKLVSMGTFSGGRPGALTPDPNGNLYGTTYSGGSNGFGTVFKLATNGALTTLASFNFVDGEYPRWPLTWGSDGVLYGTTLGGGGSSAGVVFKVTTNGTLTRLTSFNNSNGGLPWGGLTPGSDGDFYGTTAIGGSAGAGTIFRVTTNGALTQLFSFSNTNGANPLGALALGSDGNFYGAANQGGSGGGGTLFRITTNGALTTLISFDAATGQYPQEGLVVGSDGNFYGLTGSGVLNSTSGRSGLGKLFRMTPGGDMVTLATFPNPGNRLLPPLLPGTDGNFYGVTPGGSSTDPGTVFQVTPDGRFATLVSFANTNGAVPLAPLTFGSDGNLYGTTFAGGSEDRSGTVFRIVLREPVVFSQPEPANQDVVVGANINLSASYIGASPLTAQWMFNGNALPGETNATLILGNVRPSTSGNYSLRVSNSLGSTFSSNTVLAVLPALITNLPTVGITDTGAVLSASVTVGPGETLIWFEWGVDTNYGQIDGITNLPGGSGTTRFSADLSGLDKNMIYHYRVVAWNSFGIVYGSDQTFRVGRIHAYAQSVLGDRPLVYYRFNETNSSVALNSGLFGEAVNGTYGATVSLGDPSLVPAFGYAAGFNNTNTDVAVPALGSHPRITIEAWLKPRSSARFDYFDSIYATDDWTPGALHTHLVDRFSFPEFEFSINGNDPQWVNPGAPSLFLTNRWVHLAAAYDSVAREVTTYVNGKPLTTNSFRTAVPVNLTAAHIGQFKGSANWFDGEIDEFAIYDSVLSAERIREHYQAAIGNPVLLSAPLTNKLVLSWVGPGLRLEANADLANAAGWTPVIGGSNSPVTLIPSNSINQFYRLKWP